MFKKFHFVFKILMVQILIINFVYSGDDIVLLRFEGCVADTKPNESAYVEFYLNHNYENQSIKCETLADMFNALHFTQAQIIESLAFLDNNKIGPNANNLEIIPIPKLKEALSLLKENGIRIGIISGTTSANVKEFLEYNNLENYFDKSLIWTGYVFHPDFLNRAVTKLEIDPKFVVYIGNSVADFEYVEKGSKFDNCIFCGTHEELLENNNHFYNKFSNLSFLIHQRKRALEMERAMNKANYVDCAGVEKELSKTFQASLYIENAAQSAVNILIKK